MRSQADIGLFHFWTAFGRRMRGLAAASAATALALGLGAAQAQNFLVNKKFVDQQGVPNAQVNIIGPNQSVFLEFNLFNSSTGSLTVNVTDNLPAGLLGDTSFTPVITDYSGAVNGNGCSIAPGSVTVASGSVTIAGVTVPNIAAAGLNPDCRVVVKVLGDPAALGNVASNVTNSVPAANTSATGPGGPYQSDAFLASIVVQPAVNPGLSKSFNPTTVPLNGQSTLRFTIVNNAPYAIHNVTLTDALPAGVTPTGTPTTNAACGGGTAAISGQNVTLTGATISPNASCTVTATVVGAAGGTFTNNIPASAITSTEGVTNPTAATATLTVRDDLTIAKTFDDATSITREQGQAFRVRITLTNYAGSLTNGTVTDPLPTGIVLADNVAAGTTCGTGWTHNGTPGAGTITFSNLTVPAANLSTGAPGTCYVEFMAKLTANSGAITNTVNPSNVTNTQGKSPTGPASATVNATPTGGPSGGPGGGNWGTLRAEKNFVNATAGAVTTVEEGGTFWMRMGAWNPGYDWQFANGSMTDTLPVGLLVDAAGGAGALTLTPGTNLVYFGNPNQTGQGPNVSPGTNYSGCFNTGTVTVNRVAVGSTFQDTITYSGWTLQAMSANGAVTPGWYRSGCWFSIRLKGEAPGAYTDTSGSPTLPIKPRNTIPSGNVTVGPGVTNSNSVGAPITVLSDVGVRKSFNSNVIVGGTGAKRTRLTIWLTNKSSVPQTNAALTDTFPTGGGWTFAVSNPPNAGTSCAGATVTATAGAGAVSISGATIPDGTCSVPGECSFSVDVDVSGPSGSNTITNTIPPGALTTDTPGLTNVVSATASVLTRPRSIIINKTFGNGGVAQGGSPVPLTITLRGDAWAFNEVGFSDDLISVQPGLVIAPSPNVSTTCRTINMAAAPYNLSGQAVYYQSSSAPTITAVAGATTISMTGGYFPGQNAIDAGMTGSNTCTVTVDVVASTTGNKTNTIPANNVTTREGATNPTPTSATLTVQPNAQLVKTFNPSSVSAGTPFTLTFTLFNVNTSPLTNFTVADTLPSGITATSTGANTCGGTLSIIGGGTGISLVGPGTSVGANASCQWVINMIGNTVGNYTNDQNNLTVSDGVNKNTSTTVEITTATTFDLTVAKTIDASTPAPYNPGVSSVQFNLTASNNGPGASQEGIVVKDCLPQGLTYTSASGTGWSCVNNAGPITRGALTCSSEIVCTRNAGGVIASGSSANAIHVVASVDATASGTLVNYTQVNPAVGETLTETNTLGTTNGGYETGSPGTNSNNDASASIAVAAPYALGNRIWFDTNNNGIIDAGEATAPGVLVELLDSGGNVIRTTATNATGEYMFENLAAGTYAVRVAKENWTGLTAAQVAAAGNPSGLAAGQRPLAGYNNSTGAGSVDASATDATDKGIDVADPTAAGISSAPVTLGPGLQPLNEANTGDNDGVGPTTSLDANNNMTIDFGFYRLTVGDLVWRDDGNGGATPGNINNGVRDAGEAGIAGVRVELYRGGTLVAVTTTDASGNYLFTQGTNSAGVPNGMPLLPGTDYQVRIPQATGGVNTALAGFTSSAANGSSETNPLGANNDDSGIGVGSANAGVTSSASFTLGAGSNAGANALPDNATGTTAQLNVDFGFVPGYSLGNRVWVDANNNGIMDSGESGLANVLVRLLDASGNPVPGVPTQTTDGNGYYRFDGLPVGNYIVEIVPGAVGGVNYVSSTGQNGSATGPYEPGTSATAASSNDRDHGTQTTPTTIRSNPITLGPANVVTGEVNSGATGAGGNGPNGDAFDVLTADFGVFLPAKLGNLVWYDTNRDGHADPGEPGLNGVTVILYDGSGNEVARQVTRNNPTTGEPGFYEFSFLTPGSYSVKAIAPGTMVTTRPGTPSVTNGSGPDTNDSQGPGGLSIGQSAVVTVAAGDNNPQLDFGFHDALAIPTLAEAMRNLLAALVLLIGWVALRRGVARKRV